MTTNTIEEQISPRILEALFANFPCAEIAMLELADNAIGDRVPGETMILTIRISPNSIKVVNKGGYGMGIDSLRSFLTWGESRATGVFRFFGQGGKAAIGYLGKRFKVTSFPKGGDRTYIIEESADWTRRIDGQLKTYTVKEDKKFTFDSGTVQIEIFSVTRRPNIKRMRNLLQSTYGRLIDAGDLKISFNDKWISPDSIEYGSYIDIKERTPSGILKGRLGISENGHGGGIRCYSQLRLITEKETFGLNPTDYDLSKLIGELDLDFVPIMPNKISYDTGGKEWDIVEKIVTEKVSPLLEQIKGISEVPPNLQRMAKDLSDFINKALREADSDYESTGRKPQSDISNIKLILDEGERKHTPSITEPRTPTEIEDKGGTSRLGFLEVKPERMETESIRCRIVDKTAELNINYPMAKLIYAKPFKKSAYYSYALESVAMEYYKNKVATPLELVEKLNNLLSLRFQ